MVNQKNLPNFVKELIVFNVFVRHKKILKKDLVNQKTLPNFVKELIVFNVFVKHKKN